MKYFYTFSLFLIFSINLYSQTFKIGLIGGSITNFNEDFKSRSYSNLIQYGLNSRYEFDESNFSFGINILFGNKNLHNVNEPNLIYKLDASLLTIDLPINYKLMSFEELSILGGFSVGLGYFHLTEEYKGALPNILTAKSSNISWSIEPKIEMVYSFTKQLDLVLNLGYNFSKYEISSADDENNNSLGNPNGTYEVGSPDATNTFNFNSLHLLIGLMYSL